MSDTKFFCVIFSSELEPKDQFKIFDSYDKAESFIVSFSDTCREYPCSFNTALFVSVDDYSPFQEVSDNG